MIWLAIIGSCAAAAYQALALVACIAHRLRRDRYPLSFSPPISILKPVYGADLEFYTAIESHALQAYSEFEILFGIRSRSDPAYPFLERLQAAYPEKVRLIDVQTQAPNAKVGSLIDLAKAARHSVLLVNDSDIRVPKDYLSRVVAPLSHAGTGLVTCLYRASAASFPARLEGLGIATDFAPSTLVAPLVGVKEFGLGSTLCLRAKDLHRIGGFEAIAPYLADDYQLGKRISSLGLTVHLSSLSVDTHLGAGTWSDVWNHQVRWARTIRGSQGPGYAGLPVTNATLWALLLLISGYPTWAAALLALRLLVGFFCGIAILRDPLTAKFWWLMPLRDLFGLAIWAAGLAGRTVLWRGKRMFLAPDGRLVPAASNTHVVAVPDDHSRSNKNDQA